MKSFAVERERLIVALAFALIGTLAVGVLVDLSFGGTTAAFVESLVVLSLIIGIRLYWQGIGITIFNRLIPVIYMIMVHLLFLSLQSNLALGVYSLAVIFPLISSYIFPTRQHLAWSLIFAATLVLHAVLNQSGLIKSELTLVGIWPVLVAYILAMLVSTGDRWLSDLWTKSIESEVSASGQTIKHLSTKTGQLEHENKELADAQRSMKNMLEDIEHQKQSLEIYVQAIRNASDKIIITDVDGTVLFANPAAERMNGFAPSAMIGTKVGALSKGLMPNDFYAEMWKTILYEKKPFRGVWRNRRTDGREYDGELTIAPILDQQGNVTNFVEIERDITELKDLERAKTMFISMASHQLRTPLTAIRWSLDTIAHNSHKHLNAEEQKALSFAQGSTMRMIRLVVELLNVNRIESGRLRVVPTKTDVVELARTVIEELRSLATVRNITIQTELPEKGLDLSIDAMLIQQVLINFLANAIKYSPAGSTVKIELHDEEKGIRFSVVDAGIGIPPEDQPKIFHRMFRSANAQRIDREGNGLGLFLAQAIIHLSDGQIGFSSKPKVGSTFWFTLPKTGHQARDGEVGFEVIIPRDR